MTVYLWACWTGTHTRRGLGGIGKREPFARRFARAVADAGFGSLLVVGFAGSVNGTSVHQDVKIADGNEISGADLDMAEYHCVYRVANGDFNRISGRDWTTKGNPSGLGLQITVRQRGGKHNL